MRSSGCVTRISTATTRFEAAAISFELRSEMQFVPRDPGSRGRGRLGPRAPARRSLAAIVTKSARRLGAVVAMKWQVGGLRAEFFANSARPIYGILWTLCAVCRTQSESIFVQ